MQKLCFVLPWLLAAYLAGGIPFGYLIGRLRGVDVRTVGSRNIGATNVFRTVGRTWGVLTLALDMLKGLLPTLICRHCAADPQWLPLAVGVAAVLGHTLTPYMKFKGGKGVATGAGMLFGLLPALTGVTFAVFCAVFALSHYISLGSCAASLFIGAAVWLPYLGSAGTANPPQAIAVSLMALFIVWKHRANLGRLMRGCENKIYLFKKSKGKPS